VTIMTEQEHAAVTAQVETGERSAAAIRRGGAL